MSRITVTIDRVVLRGFRAGDDKSVIEGLRSELSRVLGDRSGRAEWARSHHTGVLRLKAAPLEPGHPGARKFGVGVAKAIGKSLKP